MNLKDVLSKIAAHELDYTVQSETSSFVIKDQLKLSSKSAAVLVLFQGETFESAKVLLTERSLDLATHSGQVAFPGGMMDPEDQNNDFAAALRECEEEVGISRSLPNICGRLPSFPSLTGSFIVTPVLATIEAERHLRFRLSKEVASAEWVSVSSLLSSQKWEERTVSQTQVQMPFFMWGERKMWGLSAWIFDLILKRYGTIFRI